MLESYIGFPRVFQLSFVTTLTLVVAGCHSMAQDSPIPDPQSVVRQLSDAERLECLATFDQTKAEFVISDPDTLKSLASSLKFKGAPRRNDPGNASALDIIEMTIVNKDDEAKVTLIGNVLLYGPERSFQVQLQSFDFFNKLKQLASSKK